MAGEWRTFGSINKCTSFDRVHVDMASAEHQAPRYKCPLWGRAESNSIRHANDWFRREGDRYFLVKVFGEFETYTINSSRSHHKAVSPGDTGTATP